MMHMSGINDVLMAIELQRKSPRYLRLKWVEVIEEILRNGRYSHNEMMRLLGLDSKERHNFYLSLQRLRYIGRIRKHDNLYALTGKISVRHRQGFLREYY